MVGLCGTTVDRHSGSQVIFSLMLVILAVVRTLCSGWEGWQLWLKILVSYNFCVPVWGGGFGVWVRRAG